MRNIEKELPVVLSIAGSDSGAGAGIQADLLTFAAHGVFGTTVITALTAQNPLGVSGVSVVSPAFVREQTEQVFRFFNVRAVKTGMLVDAKIIAELADFFAEHREIKLVVDPVMIATSGAKLIDDAAISVLRERLIPLASIVTPNLDEAEVFLGEKIAWRKHFNVERENFIETAEMLVRELGVPVLLKGGHGVSEKIFDVIALPGETPIQGNSFKLYEHTRIVGTNTHGSGCTLSAAIAANLAADFTQSCDEGDVLVRAVSRAIDYVSLSIAQPIFASGDRFIAHLR